ncbi:hypothetical protein E3J49_06480 [Candidatus Bathyarchaeota archaeon]|nr:MAG: hypothetical protein E3J49_06480 [Candidatus Bathyarchaeota archaeon]
MSGSGIVCGDCRIGEGQATFFRDSLLSNRGHKDDKKEEKEKLERKKATINHKASEGIRS